MNYNQFLNQSQRNVRNPGNNFTQKFIARPTTTHRGTPALPQQYFQVVFWLISIEIRY